MIPMSTATASRAGVLVEDLKQIFRERLQAVVAYGDQREGDDLACLALVAALDAADLEACARRAQAWHRHGVATPLLLTGAEFARSLDAFPLEYSEIIRTHVHVFGADPFDRLTIATEDLRRACETQVKSHLLHLREEFIESGGAPQAVAGLVRESAPAFAALLRSVARLHGAGVSDAAGATREGARLASLPEGIVSDVLALEHREGIGATDPARLFPQYLAAVERLAHFVDSWRA
jgi:hypothetical protein